MVVEGLVEVELLRLALSQRTLALPIDQRLDPLLHPNRRTKDRESVLEVDPHGTLGCKRRRQALETGDAQCPSSSMSSSAATASAVSDAIEDRSSYPMVAQAARW